MAVYDPAKHCGAQRLGQPTGVLCTRPKGWGTSHSGVGHCKRHGGSTRTHATNAQTEVARMEVTRLGLAHGQDGSVDPRDALARELWRAYVSVAVLEHLVGQLPLTEGGIYGRTYHATGERTGEAKPHVLVEMWWEERRRLVSVATAAAKAGVEERRAQIAEEQASEVARLITAVIEGLGLTAKKREEAMRSAAQHLRSLPSHTAVRAA